LYKDHWVVGKAFLSEVSQTAWNTVKGDHTRYEHEGSHELAFNETIHDHAENHVTERTSYKDYIQKLRNVHPDVEEGFLNE